jgi:hypothetical protein
MTINGYAKQWCEEDYDIRKEEFYIENAYYVADREWAINGFKHGLMAIVVAIATFMLSNSASFWIRAIDAFVVLGILTISFGIYGLRNYNANSIETGLPMYVMVAILLFLTKARSTETCCTLFAFASFPLYLFITFINPIKFLFTANKMKQRIIDAERDEDNDDKQSYARWENGYKAYRYGLPECETEKGDPVMDSARQMFDGYKDNKQMLKTRYRQLAKQYHPDKGGDTKLFQCIIAAYEEFNNAMT